MSGWRTIVMKKDVRSIGRRGRARTHSAPRSTSTRTNESSGCFVTYARVYSDSRVYSATVDAPTRGEVPSIRLAGRAPPPHLHFVISIPAGPFSDLSRLDELDLGEGDVLKRDGRKEMREMSATVRGGSRGSFSRLRARRGEGERRNAAIGKNQTTPPSASPLATPRRTSARDSSAPLAARVGTLARDLSPEVRVGPRRAGPASGWKRDGGRTHRADGDIY